jgi:hypothetical protein
VQTPTFTTSASPELGGDGASQTGQTRKDAFVKGIESAASTLRDRADSLPGGEKVASAAYTAADAMETAADYFDTRDLSEILSDMQQIVRKHPGAVLVTAAALGFMLARTFSRH